MPLTLPHQDREKQSAALSSLLAAVVLTAFKAVVGALTGSLGILAEAAHSGLDLVAALMTFLAVRISGRPPDTTHPYGHGKVENLSALFNEMGEEGWELVQLFFHQSGIVSFWKRVVKG